MILIFFYIYFSDNNGRASPSTQEAIAGMLSISQTYLQGNKANSRSLRKYSASPPPEEGNLNNVHQDEDYGNQFKIIIFCSL